MGVFLYFTNQTISCFVIYIPKHFAKLLRRHIFSYKCICYILLFLSLKLIVQYLRYKMYTLFMISKYVWKHCNMKGIRSVGGRKLGDEGMGGGGRGGRK